MVVVVSLVEGTPAAKVPCKDVKRAREVMGPKTQRKEGQCEVKLRQEGATPCGTPGYCLLRYF